MSKVTDAFNAAKKTNPNAKLSDFVNQANPSTTLPTPTPAVTTSVTERDLDRENSFIKKLGINTVAAGALDPKKLYEGTYSANELKGLQDYQEILQRDQAKQNLLATDKPTNTMMGVLEEALRMKSDPARQALGGSELYAAAGLPTSGVSAYSTLLQSMNQRGQEMKDRYGSFVGQLSKVGGAMADAWTVAAEKYKTLNDDYQIQVAQMQKAIENLQGQEQAMAILDRQAQIQKDYFDWQKDYDKRAGDKIDAQLLADFNAGKIKSSDSSDVTNMKVVDENNPFGVNCITFQRDEGANMPYGLFSIADKEKAIALAGYDRFNMDSAQIGDVILTSEGDYGHAARIIGIDGNKLMLREANYVPGKVTEGRIISKNDTAMLGYIPQGERNKMMDQQAGDDQSVLDEGTNPAIQDQAIKYKSANGGDTESVLPKEIEERILLSLTATPFQKTAIKEGLNAEGYGNWVTAVETGDYSDMLGENSKYTDAMQTLMKTTPGLPGDRPQKLLKMAKNLMAGNIDAAKKQFAAEFVKSKSGAERGIFGTGKQMLKDLATFDEAFAAAENSGIVAGNLSELAEKLGQVGQYSELAARVNRLVQLYTKGQTGAAFSFQEFERYAALFPDITNTPALNRAKIKALGQAIVSQLDGDLATNTGEYIQSLEEYLPQSDWAMYGLGAGRNQGQAQFSKQLEEARKTLGKDEVIFQRGNDVMKGKKSEIQAGDIIL